MPKEITSAITASSMPNSPDNGPNRTNVVCHGRGSAFDASLSEATSPGVLFEIEKSTLLSSAISASDLMNGSVSHSRGALITCAKLQRDVANSQFYYASEV